MIHRHLVDIELCKLVLGLESQGRDKFLNSNINLAAGSGNFTTFSPDDPPIALETGLSQRKTVSSWDNIVVTFGPTNEVSFENLVQYLENAFLSLHESSEYAEEAQPGADILLRIFTRRITTTTSVRERSMDHTTLMAMLVEADLSLELTSAEEVHNHMLSMNKI